MCVCVCVCVGGGGSSYPNSLNNEKDIFRHQPEISHCTRSVQIRLMDTTHYPLPPPAAQTPVSLL